MGPVVLRASTIARLLTVMAVVLIIASVAGQLTKYIAGHHRVFGLVDLFFLDGEANIPSYFSVLLMIFIAILLAMISALTNSGESKYGSSWGALSLIFLCLAADDAFSFHEQMNAPLRELLGNRARGFLHFPWVIPGALFVLLLVILYLRTVLQVSQKVRFNFIVAAVLFIGGAIGIELVGAKYAELNGTDNLTYSLITTVEESLEMAGLIVFIYALLRHIADNYKKVSFDFQ